jgi:thiol-disulfide isomerase/thioredoxin
MLRRLGGALALVMVFTLAARADDKKAPKELGIGDDAPKLGVATFVKGEPVKELAKKKVYVLEFWATWCGPCVAAIPHVTELQKKYPDVVFIGVNVWERDEQRVKPFVEKMGEKMAYRVAMDDKSNNDTGFMAAHWLQPAGQDGIPCTFIIDGDGKIAWIGHPMRMDKPLADIVAGTWDLQAAAKKFKAERERAAKMEALQEKLGAALEKGPAAAVKVLDEAIAADAEIEQHLGHFKFNLLVQQKDYDKALAYGQHLVEKVLGDEANTLNHIAWELVDPDREGKVDAKLVKFAVTTAEKADKLAMKEGGGTAAAVADTLARAYFVDGQIQKAYDTQLRAVKLAKGTEMEKDEDLNKRLAEYKKALEKS